MILFWDQTGPAIRYVNRTMEISDLNPEVHTRWTMSRLDMFILGIRCICAAIWK